VEKFDRTEFDEVRPNGDEDPFRAQNGPEAQSQRFALGRQSPLKTRLFPRRYGRLSVFATGMMAEGMGLLSNLLQPDDKLISCFHYKPKGGADGTRETLNEDRRLHLEIFGALVLTVQ
jgi:hypothetical protein